MGILIKGVGLELETNFCSPVVFVMVLRGRDVQSLTW